MSKAITVRLDDDSYKLLTQKAKAEKRSLANYIEYAAFTHALESEFVSDEEMKEILSDKPLMRMLKRGNEDMAKGRGRLAYRG